MKFKIKKLIAITFGLSMILVLCGCVYNAKAENLLDIKLLNYKDNTIEIALTTPNEIQECKVEISSDSAFKNSKIVTCKTDGTKNVIENVNGTCYLRTKETFQILESCWSDTYELKEHEHNNVLIKEDSSKSTCFENGRSVYRCEKCDNINIIIADKLPHTNKLLNKKEPTCQDFGAVVYACTECGEKTEDKIEKIDCNYKKVKTINPTCTKEGSHIYECTMCKKQKSEKIATIPHDYKEKTRVASTCTEKGTINYECKVCAKTKTEQIPLKAHSFDTLSVKKSTCSQEGYEKLECSSCGLTKTNSLSKKSHSYSYLGESTEGSTIYYKYKCDNCGKSKTETGSIVYSDYHGTLIMPGINVKVYNGYNDLQTIVDRWDSACYFSYRGKKVIADHKHQDNFEAIKSAYPGMIARVGNEKYKCVNVYQGYNKKTDLTTTGGTSIRDLYGDLFMYTCNQDSYHITIVSWVKL